MSLEETAPPLADGEAVWPVEPDPAVTNLPGRQLWRLRGGRIAAAEVGGVRIAAGDARIEALGVRRDAAGRPWPAAFAHAPDTGEALSPPPPDPEVLDIDADSARELPLPSGLPALARAGRPAGLYVLQENLGVLETWDGQGFVGMGRLPVPGPGAPGLAAGPHGLAYAAGDRLVRVPLPQIPAPRAGADLARTVAGAPGLRRVSAPCWRGTDLLALGVRGGRLVLCRAGADATAPEVRDLAPAPAEGGFAGPWTNRLGDAFWTGVSGSVAWPLGAEAAFAAWPEGFTALPALAPWRDRADGHHQLGLTGGRYAYAALGGPVHRLDGPHLAAGAVTYAGAERFDVPWEAPAEALTLGAHAGSLLVPLLAMARDTVLLALPIEGPRAPFLRGQPLPAQVTGFPLHHAHGAGLRRLPVALEVRQFGDAGAFVHAGALHLWSRAGRRCHALALRA